MVSSELSVHSVMPLQSRSREMHSPLTHSYSPAEQCPSTQRNFFKRVSIILRTICFELLTITVE